MKPIDRPLPAAALTQTSKPLPRASDQAEPQQKTAAAKLIQSASLAALASDPTTQAQALSMLSPATRTDLFAKIRRLPVGDRDRAAKVFRIFMQSVLAQKLTMASADPELERLAAQVATRMESDPELSECMDAASKYLIEQCRPT